MTAFSENVTVLSQRTVTIILHMEMAGDIKLEDFPNRPPPLVCREFNDREGLGIFRIRLLVRERHTWQGNLIREDEKREFFHSKPELLQLPDEVPAQRNDVCVQMGKEGCGVLCADREIFPHT